jgi:hypothetical protein
MMLPHDTFRRLTTNTIAIISLSATNPNNPANIFHPLSRTARPPNNIVM